MSAAQVWKVDILGGSADVRRWALEPTACRQGAGFSPVLMARRVFGTDGGRAQIRSQRGLGPSASTLRDPLRERAVNNQIRAGREACGWTRQEDHAACNFLGGRHPSGRVQGEG